MFNSGNPRIRTLTMASPGKQLPRFVWSELAVVELLRALTGTARAFLVGEFSEDNNDATVRVDRALPFPANLRPDHLMSVRDWQLLNEEVKRLSGRGLVGICRTTSADVDGGAIADRKILDKYGAFGVRLLAVIDPEEVSQAVAQPTEKPNVVEPTLSEPVEASPEWAEESSADADLVEPIPVDAAPETTVIHPPVEEQGTAPTWPATTAPACQPDPVAPPAEPRLARSATASANFASTIPLPMVPLPPIGERTGYPVGGASIQSAAIPRPASAPVASPASVDAVAAFQPEDALVVTPAPSAPSERGPVEALESRIPLSSAIVAPPLAVSLPEKLPATPPSAPMEVQKKSPMTKVVAGIAAVLVCGAGIWTVAANYGTPAAKRPPAAASTPAVTPEVVSVPVRPIAVQKEKASPSTVAKAIPVKPLPRPVEPIKAPIANDSRRKAPVTVALDPGAAQKAKREAALRALDQQ